MSDKFEARYMTAGQLMMELSKLPTDMPVDFSPIGVPEPWAGYRFCVEIGVGSPELFGANGDKPTDDNKPHTATFWTYEDESK